MPGSIPNELAANADYPPGAPDLPAACSGAAQSVDELIDLVVAEGETVFIRVALSAGVAGSFSLSIEAPAPPNDDAAQATATWFFGSDQAISAGMINAEI